MDDRDAVAAVCTSGGGRSGDLVPLVDMHRRSTAALSSLHRSLLPSPFDPLQILRYGIRVN